MREVQLLTSAGAFTAVSVRGPAAAESRHALRPGHALDIVRELRRGANRTALVALYSLATGVEPYMPSRLRDADLVSAIDVAIESGRVVFTKGWSIGGRRSDGPPDAQGAGAAAKLARAIMGDRDDLLFDGRRYRLTASASSARQDERDGYRRVALGEAASLVKRMAQTVPATPEESARWKQAVALMTALGHGKELILLRFAPTGSPAAHNTGGPAATPSQLHPDAAPEHWVEVEIVYDDGTAFAGNCVLELPGGRTSEGPPAARGIVRVDGLSSGSCRLRIPGLDADAFKTG